MKEESEIRPLLFRTLAVQYTFVHDCKFYAWQLGERISYCNENQKLGLRVDQRYSHSLVKLQLNLLFRAELRIKEIMTPSDALWEIFFFKTIKKLRSYIKNRFSLAILSLTYLNFFTLRDKLGKLSSGQVLSITIAFNYTKQHLTSY